MRPIKVLHFRNEGYDYVCITKDKDGNTKYYCICCRGLEEAFHIRCYFHDDLWLEIFDGKGDWNPEDAEWYTSVFDKDGYPLGVVVDGTFLCIDIDLVKLLPASGLFRIRVTENPREKTDGE